MSDSSKEPNPNNNHIPPAPEPAPAPPPPPPPAEDPRNKTSHLTLKLQSPPPGYFHQPPRQPRHPAPTGPYFLYGTLTDPCMIAEILNLDEEPDLRPAYITGYKCKLWGQYPALLDADADVGADAGAGTGADVGVAAVRGAVYDVNTVEDGEKLAAYETGCYQAGSCWIRYVDGEEPGEEVGSVFKFVGSERDLSDGHFELKAWLKRMGRTSAIGKLEAKQKAKGAVAASNDASHG